MPKKADENFHEYRERTINKISPTFCGAKWYQSTVWLGNGTTSSCNHPVPHKIPLEELAESYKALHNTKYKKMVRKQMLEGERPEECDYCWRIENLNEDLISDRTYRSNRFSDEDLWAAKDIHGYQENVDPQYLEVAFDANCNFGCMYCNSGFSTTWQTEIKTKGPYQNMLTVDAKAYNIDSKYANPYGQKNEGNPYTEAFLKWWEADLQYSLKRICITGGEVTMSPTFWNLIDWWKDHPECKVSLAVNTNLGVKQELIERLIQSTHYTQHFGLHTSCEATGEHAEYIRDGLDYVVWVKNLRAILERGKVNYVFILTTINMLSIFTLTDFLDDMIEIKKDYPNIPFLFSLKILTFPSFQSMEILPHNIRNEQADIIEKWVQKNWYEQEETSEGRGYLILSDFERLKRLIEYLRDFDEASVLRASVDSRIKDFKTFFTEYDKRRNLSFVNTFPQLADWYNSIPITKTIPITLAQCDYGEPTSNWQHQKDLKKRAEEEGWDLTPKNILN